MNNYISKYKITNIRTAYELQEALHLLNRHTEECTVFRGFILMESSISTDGSWEAKVMCSCDQEFHVIRNFSEWDNCLADLEKYIESSTMFSKAIREKAIKNKTEIEEIFCPILGIFYENQELKLDEGLIEME